MAIKEAMRTLPFKRVMLDGEAVAHCLDGLPDFHRLLGDGQAKACFYAFDLLWLEAQDVRGVELIGRRRMLQKALKKAGSIALGSSTSPTAPSTATCTTCAALWRNASRSSRT